MSPATAKTHVSHIMTKIVARDRAQLVVGAAYSGFRSAVDKGASCAELFDQRGRFSRAEDLARIDADRARIGCGSRDSVRNRS